MIMKISIITICWNNLTGLKKTMSSISEQTHKDFEWIVIDGASTDGTQVYLKNSDIPKLRYISEKDEGIYDAMNKGINMASGDFMVFLNSGDMFMDPESLTLVSENLNKNVLFLYGDSLDISLNGQEYYRKAKDHSSVYKGMFTQHQSMFFACLKNANKITYNKNYSLSADYDFIIQYLNIAQNQGEIVKIEKALSRFELGGLNETRRYKALIEDFKIRKHQMALPITKNIILYLAHFLHTSLKRIIPDLMKKLRYE